MRKSHGMPAARIIGPEKPQAIASSLLTMRDIDVALLEDAVVDDQAHRVLEQARQAGVEPVGDVGQQLERDVLVHAAGAEPGDVHPRAGGALEEVEAILADLEQPQVRRHRADVHDVAAEVEHVVADAGQLGEQHPQILRAERHFEVEQLLDREDVAVLHRQRRAVIEPVEIGQRLQIGLVLDQLLGAAVEQADVRIDPLDDLAVELHHHAQHAVRRRVLRAEVDRVVGDDLVAGGRRLFESETAHGVQFQMPGANVVAPPGPVSVSSAAGATPVIRTATV